MRHIDVKKTVLSNGLRLITVRRDTDIFSLAAGVKVGSLYEDDKNNGITHMVEHMLFKGTEKRDMDTLNDDMEKLAGDLDIYTSYNQTVLTTSIMKSHGGEALEIISDMLMNASFPKKEFPMEKKVIIEEIKMEKDDPEDLSYLGFFKTAFPDKWYKYHIAGTIKSVRAIKNDMLKDYYTRFYRPNNTAISIVSSFEHEEVEAMVCHYFGDWQEKPVQEPPKLKYEILPSRVLRHKTAISQAHILYGFDIQNLDRREEIALVLLNKKLGSGGNSVLFKELRDKKGYAYNVYSDLDLIEGIRMLYIYAAVSEENVKDAEAVINKVISRYQDGSLMVDDSAITLIKDIFQTDITNALESADHIADYLLQGELNYNNPLEYQNTLSIMDTLTSHDIKKVVDKVLKNPIVHILMPK